jgi:hypothetical protein
MTNHRTQYLLAAKDQSAYDRFASVDEPERLEAELALARSLCETATNAGHHGLAASLLAVIAKLSSATTAQKVRVSELLEKRVALQLGLQIVELLSAELEGKFVGWEDTLTAVADKLTATIERTSNEPKLLEGPK